MSTFATAAQSRFFTGAFIFVLFGAFALFGSSQSVSAKGSIDLVNATVSLPPVYSITPVGAVMEGSTLTLTGRAAITNFAGREDEQFMKFSWGDGTTEIVKAMSIPSYYKSSKNITLSAWNKSHIYAKPEIAFTVTVTLYHGSSKGSESYPKALARSVLQTENMESGCLDGIDNDRDNTKDLADADCEQFQKVENSLELCGDGFEQTTYSGTADLTDPNCAPFIPTGSGRGLLFGWHR